MAGFRRRGKSSLLTQRRDPPVTLCREVRWTFRCSPSEQSPNTPHPLRRIPVVLRPPVVLRAVVLLVHITSPSARSFGVGKAVGDTTEGPTATEGVDQNYSVGIMPGSTAASNGIVRNATATTVGRTVERVARGLSGPPRVRRQADDHTELSANLEDRPLLTSSLAWSSSGWREGLRQHGRVAPAPGRPSLPPWRVARRHPRSGRRPRRCGR